MRRRDAILPLLRRANANEARRSSIPRISSQIVRQATKERLLTEVTTVECVLGFGTERAEGFTPGS